jgi:3-oxoacyl-[acyl-carrier protein] reductase
MTSTSSKVAVITGASRGLGRAAALRLSQDGFTVVINYCQNRSEAEQLQQEILQAGHQALLIQGDLSSKQGVDDFFTQTDHALTQAMGSHQFDALICNAGMIRMATIATTTEADFDALFNLNVKGVFFCIQQALSRLRTDGTIVNLGTGLTRFSYPQYAAYAASKGAIDVLTKTLAKEIGRKELTINTVAPGPIDTDMNADWLRQAETQDYISSQTALARIGLPNDIAGVISFLCGADSRWMTGQRLEVSGGIHL